MASKEYRVAYSGGAGKIDLVLHVYTVKTDISKNQTTERCDLYMDVKDASSQYFNNYGTEAYVKAHTSAKIETVTFDARTTGNKILINSFDTVFTHDANGECAFGVEAHHYSGVGLGNAVITGMFTCDKIARYGTCNQSLSSKTETSIFINWSSDNTVDNVWYSKDNGTTWIDVGAANAKNGSYTISGLVANTSYNIKTKIRRKDSQLTTESTVLAVTTYNYPYIIGITTANLIIGNAQKVTLYNPLKRNVTVKMNKESASGTQLYSGTTTGMELTFTPTVNTLYSSIPSAQSAKCVYSVIYGSITKTSSVACTYKIKGTEKPTFTNFTYADTNTNSTAVTGNNQILVNGASNVQAIISTTNKATSNYGASIVKYRITIGTQSKEIAYSSATDVSTTINNISSGTIQVSAIDSRGLETVVSKIATFKAYWKPYYTKAEVSREDGIGTTVYFNISGKYWNENFGEKQNNIINARFRYKTKNSEWSDWIVITTFINPNNGNFYTNSNSLLPSTDVTIPLAFALGVQYDIQFKVADEILQTVVIDTVLNSGIPAIDTIQNSDGKYSHGINCLADSNYALKIDGNLKATDIHIDFKTRTNLGYEFKYRKIGLDIVECVCYTNGNDLEISNNSNFLIGTLPQGYRPFTILTIPVVIVALGGTYINSGFYLQINTNGEVKLYNRTGTKYRVYSIFSPPILYSSLAIS